MYLITLKFCEV